MNEKIARLSTTFLALLIGLAGWQGALVAQDGGSSRARVLVAPPEAGANVNFDFGKEIAEKIRDRIGDFDILRAVDNDEVEDAIDRFELDMEQMDLVQWRQLAGQLNAGLIIHGQIDRSGDQYTIEPLFVDASQGEEFDVSPISTNDDGGDQAEEVANHVLEALREQVQYLRALANCQEYLSGGRFEDARRNCNQALEVNPESNQALALRGQIGIESEDWEAAREDFATILERDSSNENALQSLAYANAQLENMDRAMELYREYLQYNPADEEVRLNVAYNLASAGGYAEAMELLREGIERDSTSAPLWKYLGDVAIRQGTESGSAQIAAAANGQGATITDTAAIRTALDAYRKYTELEPDSVSPNIYRNRIKASMQLDDLEQAFEISEEALQRLDQEAPIWSLRADILSQRDDLEGAAEAMDSVLARDSSYQDAYFKRGVFEIRAGNTDAALSDFEEAVERGTSPDRIGNQLFGRGYQNNFQEDQYEPAIEMFETGLEFAESDQLRSQLHFWTAYSYYLLGRNLDEANAEAEECGPATEAVGYLEEVMPHLQEAGDYQQESQAQIAEAVDALIYRQEQIQKQSC